MKRRFSRLGRRIASIALLGRRSALALSCLALSVACSNDSNGNGGSGGQSAGGENSGGDSAAAGDANGGNAGGSEPTEDVCLWSHLLELSNPTVITDEGGVCANSDLGLDAAGIAALDGSELAYGLLLEFQGHADIVLQYDDAAADWMPIGPVAYDAATDEIDYTRPTNAACGYGSGAADAGSIGADAGAPAFSKVGVCGVHFEGSADEDSFSGFQEYYLVSEESVDQGLLDEFICTVRFDLERIGEAPPDCGLP